MGNDRYLVRTERVAPGVPLAEEQVEWAVEEWLLQARQLMNNPLLRLLQGNATQDWLALGMTDESPTRQGFGLASAVQPSPQADVVQSSLSMVQLGQQLYSALFQGTLRDSWVTAQGIAQNRGEALRLRLGLKGSHLLRLPWEILYGNDVPAERLQGSMPLATGTHVIFSRHQPGARLVGDGSPLTIEPGQPLRILMVISAPTDQERLELHREANQLQQELRSQPTETNGNAPEIHLTLLSQPGREQLTQALEQGQYQVLHYAGHSDLGVAGGSLYLVNNRTGLTEILNGNDLAGLLVNNGIRFAVFNSCRGSYTAAEAGGGDRDRNLAEALVGRGIPAVLAMAEQIPDNVALTLTSLFYRNLKQGYPIDLSLSRARQGLLSAYGSHQLYWALPILYQHPDFDGYLTPGDHTFDNPVDRLVLIPPGSSSLPPTLAGEEGLPFSLPLISAPPAPEEDDMVWSAVVLDEAGPEEDELGDWMSEESWSDDLEFPEEGDEEDVSFVSDLLGQISPQSPPSAPSSQPRGTAVPARPMPPVAPIASRSPANSPPQSPANSAPKSPTNTPANNRGGSSITLINPKLQGQITKRDSSKVVQSTPQQPLTVGTPSGAAAATMPQPQARSMSPDRTLNRKALLPFIGAAGALAIALIGYWFLPQTQLMRFLSQIPQSTVLDNTQELQKRETKELAALASDRLNKNQTAEGAQALRVLLDRGSLPEVAAVLGALQGDQISNPEISYLRGRLAWQSVQTGDANYSLEDARRSWESAVNAQDDSVEYHKALGFAYYAESKPWEAMQSWARAIAILENRQNQTSNSELNSEPTSEPNSDGNGTSAAQLAESNTLPLNQETLSLYAGIALAMRQAANDPLEPQENLGSKAQKIYQMVLSSDPVNFQPQALSKDWLWNESAIKDWQALGLGQ
ncbi:MAG: CHAT domain-containing protein [Oculatellaceae cyanobacterium Prado106]|nr:CHAT domain-containing protein [Oculatellaceae cyanobacterium Prado106]